MEQKPTFGRGGTHCIHGHEYSPENTYIHKTHQSRVCRICQRGWTKAYRDRIKTGKQIVRNPRDCAKNGKIEHDPIAFRFLRK